ncbi:MAG: hypothetical protein AB1671_02485 [Thermodesulfobacteriota bacterium]|jgi:hypothetical protein
MRGNNTPRIGWASLLVAEFSMFTFLWYALTVAEGKRTPPSSTAIVHGKEVCMRWQHDAADTLHTEVHIDICPNDVLHVKIGNICLHLCRKDFLQLARAVAEAAAQVSDSPSPTRTAKGNVH